MHNTVISSQLISPLPSVLVFQIDEVVAEGDICRFIIQSQSKFEQGLYKESAKHQASAHTRVRIEESSADLESADTASEDSSNTSSSTHFLETLMREHGTDSPSSSLIETVKILLRDNARHYSQLEHASTM